ncbi:hypothetical protein OVA24_17760 [Luteolibacter sp. SL250]|uniref:hypothetical protein n=1 Tax=Luteolibacter sp. SL250 TaxID=2995170 RepID=UPI0022707941|nr:hypothetical protein [Luteolibacter sp. SL250]WAC19076.1 hypothetical protein OVA24_17760 [Luteolibacter sp. SL250]
MNPATHQWFDGPPALNRRFVIYLPSRKEDGAEIPRLQQLASGIAGMLSERFGGATTYPATGHFGSQREDILVIECFCGEKAWQASSSYLFSLVKALGAYCDQEMIACSLDGTMLLVSPHAGDRKSAPPDRSIVESLMVHGH